MQATSTQPTTKPPLQGFLGGATVFTDWERYGRLHANWVHAFELVPILLAVAGFAGRDKSVGIVGIALFFGRRAVRPSTP